jgi:hypothetical protein
MQPNFSLQQQVYNANGGTTPTNYPILSDRDPTANDTNYNIGRFWINKDSKDFFYLNGLSSAVSGTNPYGQMQAIWVPFNQADQLSFVTDAGTANPLSDIINIIGENGITVTASGNTIIISGAFVAGLWTPIITIGGSSVGITYTTSAGGYTLNGNVVTIWADILLSSTGGLTGNVAISNLPIPLGVNGVHQNLGVSLFGGWTLANYTSMSLLLGPSSSIATFAASGSGQGPAVVDNTQITNSFNVRFNASYILN